MKKIIALLLALVLILSLTGCGLSEEDKEKYIAAVDEKIQERISHYTEVGSYFFSDYIDVADISYEILGIEKSKDSNSLLIVTIQYKVTTADILTDTEKSLAWYDLQKLFTSCKADDGKSITVEGRSKSDETFYCHYSLLLNDEEINSSYSNGTTSTSKSSSSTSTDGYGHDKFDAMVVAKNIVKNKLKSPSTASFCSTSDATISCSGNTWTVKGWVDAQNSFGATVRNNFTVKFTFSSDEKYTVDSCSIN